jgi:capsular exopolysaccharide synthesis family protein
VCANLAGSLAEAGMRVVAADFDLRHPNLHSWLGGHNEVGLSDVLLNRVDLDAALQFIPVGSGQGGLYLLPTGSPVNDPTELLGTTRTLRVLDTLSEQADILLLDTPPVLPVADTLVIGRVAGGAVLVVEGRSTPSTVVLQAKDALIRNRTRLLGVILNKAQERDLEGSGYGYGYGYGADDDER